MTLISCWNFDELSGTHIDKVGDNGSCPAVLGIRNAASI